MTTPRVFLTDLHAYNSGSLHGRWVDATDADEMLEAVTEILASSPHPGGEEFFITDYDNFGGYQVGEYEPIEKVATIGAAIEEHGDAVGVWLNYDKSNFDRLDQFEDYYGGETDSEESYRSEQWNELVLEQIRAELHSAGLLDAFERSIEPYIDVEAASRDFGDDVTFLSHNGAIHVFRNDA
jgi:antirestriction protein